jgi:hypothetical protein
MKTVIEIVKKTSFVEVAVFAGVACMALTAGYASLSRPMTAYDNNGDITGTAHPIKITPLTTMQPMPDPIDQQQR